jgi:hypothetical protein
MEVPRVKFAIQSPDETLSGATDTVIDQITPAWVRFAAPGKVLEGAGLDPASTLSEEDRMVMFIYLDPLHPPIRAIGRTTWCERVPEGEEELYSVVVEFREIAEEDRASIRKYLRQLVAEEGTSAERRGEIRRQSDRFFREMDRILEILANMSEGRREDFGEQFANLVGVKNSLGRRLEDKKLGDAICYNMERLASNIARLVGGKAGLRKVRIRKVTGKEDAVVAKDRVLLGWEEAPPREGKSYCMYMEGGGIFRSALVTQVLKDHFRTRNSLYEIEEV